MKVSYELVLSICGTLGDQITQYRLAHWAVSPGIDANVDHPAPLTPSIVDVAVQEPVTVVGGSVLAEAIVVVAVSSVRKVTSAHRPWADPELCGALMYLGEARFDVPLSPGRAAPVTSPTAVVVAGQKDFPASQFSHHGQRVGNLSEGEVTEHPDVVAGIHCLVPSLDEGAVHRVGVGEGPIWSSR
jgi:hypothetical protein